MNAVHRPNERPGPADDAALEQRARSLYPDDAYLQAQWLRGVRLVRTTARGWLLDPPPLAALRGDERARGD